MQSAIFNHYKGRRSNMREPAFLAIQAARSDFAHGYAPWERRELPAYAHGDVLRGRDAAGNKRTFVLAIVNDEDCDAPWERSEGHGPVSDWTSRAKAPGERVMNTDGPSKRYYDWAAAIQIAKRDSWGLSPEAVAALTAKLGRQPTKGEVTAESVRLDYEFLRDWCNDRWNYVGIVLLEMSHDEYRSAEFAADNPDYQKQAAALWGIESNATDYIQETVLELFSEALTN